MNWDMLQKSVPVAVLFLVLILLVAFHALPPKHSTGFFVGLAPARCAEDVSDRLIVLRIAEEGARPSSILSRSSGILSPADCQKFTAGGCTELVSCSA